MAGGALIAIAALLGVAALLLVYFVISLAIGITSPVGVGLFAFIPLALYVVFAVVLAARPRTGLFGTGLLLGLGVWLLIGGGPCVAFHIQSGAGI